MPKLSPVSWVRFVKRLHELGFSGPYQEGRHPYMIRREVSITIPNPHGEDVSPDLLQRILKQAGVSRNDWLRK